MSKHAKISLFKSALRIMACLRLAYGDLVLAALFLFLAEILGIVEEAPGSYKGTEWSESKPLSEGVTYIETWLGDPFNRCAIPGCTILGRHHHMLPKPR